MTEHGFFEPDILITAQLASPRRRRAALSSEKRLMLAVLENALDYYRKYLGATDRIGRTLFMEAAEWFASTSNDDFLSFENVSETLDINPGYLRRGIAAWHQRLLDAQSGSAEVDQSPQQARAAS